MLRLITPQHTLHQIPQRAPEILARSLVKPVLIHKQYIMLEARVEMWLKSQMDNDRIVMAIDVCVDPVEALEELAECHREVFREWDTDTGWEGGFVVDV